MGNGYTSHISLKEKEWSSGGNPSWIWSGWMTQSISFLEYFLYKMDIDAIISRLVDQ
jgi:hypothetical protein